MPDVGRFLVTDERVGGGEQFNPVVVRPKKGGPWFLENVRYYNTALELKCDRLVALDTDAYLVAPAYELFDILDRFDFVGVHEGPRHTAKTIGSIPDVLSEFNVGVLAFRNNDKVKSLFATWLRLYEENVSRYGNNDQAPLREAIWTDKSGLQIHIMPSEYNCRFHFGTQVRGKVRVLHGGSKNIDKVARVVNKNAGTWRVWEPKELLRL